MTLEELLPILAEVIQQRGYFVVNVQVPVKIGHIFNEFMVHKKGPQSPDEVLQQPLRVIQETDRKDWDEQLALARSLHPESSANAWGRFFYRTVTD